MKRLIQTKMPQRLKAKAQQRTILITFLVAGLASHPCHAHHSDNREIEIFQCGSLGRVTLTTSKDEAELEISNKMLVAVGVIHSFMGGNDRTFTRSQSDDFRSPDETTKSNPLTLSIVSGYVYGKEREQVTIYTQNEAKTCIRENEKNNPAAKFEFQK